LRHKWSYYRPAMHTLFILLFLSFQSMPQNPGQQSEVERQRREAALHSVPDVASGESKDTPEAMRKKGASMQDQLFVAKFNKLINTLMEFADDYKTRQSINVKKAKAVRAAWLELEETEALFRGEKKK